MTIVSGAVAGDDLEQVAWSAAEALGCPVAIAIPARGAAVVQPPEGLDVAAITRHAHAVIAGEAETPPTSLGEAVPIQVGQEIVGIVAAAAGPERADRRMWLDAVAAAAAVRAMMPGPRSARYLLDTLLESPPSELPPLLGEAPFSVNGGVVAICAVGSARAIEPGGGIFAQVMESKLLGLVALGDGLESITTQLDGLTVGVSAPRRDPVALGEALREAELLAELAAAGAAAGQEETYRLLIGVLLRDPGELEQLRESTISSLVAYDAGHETDLIYTLQAFLVNHGSTTETALRLGLHRHTVGYRLSRVEEVSGLSPYESEGRERLSLGLKAQQILEARKRIYKPE